MHIAFTYNLQTSDDESQAEFDRPETIDAITAALEANGHRVDRVEVSGPASQLVARLEALGPDLIFNTAEGSRGRYREAFYPGLFDQLGIPFTGSDAYTCALTLDKHLTKTVLRSHGIPMPAGFHLTSLDEVAGLRMRYPLIAKPNYEGSSMGITQASVVEDRVALARLAEELLERFPSGLIVEEYVEGRDVVVPFLEGASRKTHGVLEPGAYRFDAAAVEGRRFNIYDYALKSTDSDAVHVVVPADVPRAVRDEAMATSRIIFDVLGIRDAGRVDFRLDTHGRLHFLEINALPSFEPGASIYESAAIAGLSTVEDVIGSIVDSAARRHGLDTKKRAGRSRRAALRVGLTYNLRRAPVTGEGDGEGDTTSDGEAEYDAPETIEALEAAIRSFGHDVVLLEATPELPSRLPVSDLDLVFNIAEGVSGRNREAQVPALLELLDIPYTGSDPVALSASLDKALAKKLVSHAGLRTPAFAIMRTGRERLPKDLTFPVLAKPVAEGSSKGVSDKSVAEGEAELRALVPELVAQYGQPVLVESFLSGREFTVALLGERRPRALPPMEIVFVGDDPHPIYSFAHKFEGKAIRFEVPAKVDAKLGKELERVARGAFVALGCRDVARVDLRLDADGHVSFIEANPLPGLTPGFSDLCVIAEAAGLDYRTLIGEIMAPAVRRLREARRRRGGVASARSERPAAPGPQSGGTTT